MNPEIVMYARERPCSDVQRSRDRLDDLGLAWVEHDIESDPDVAIAVEEMTGSLRVPTIVIGDVVLIEPSNDELDDALRNAGYEIARLSRST